MELSDSTILKVSLILSVLGVAFLSVFSLSLEPTQTSIENISSKDIGLRVSIEAKIIKTQLTQNALIFWLNQNGKTLQAVKFNYSLEDLQLLQEKKQIRITGTIQKYNKSLEIVVEKMERIE
ncbi:MAG: OB-fold nucleic acid binding domain-containing protein [archaeon]|nr:OB-fold nucleic acid binding domain-containing protein [archaeon]